MSLTDINNESRYLISTEEDELWGLVVTSVGSQTISAKRVTLRRAIRRAIFSMWTKAGC